MFYCPITQVQVCTAAWSNVHCSSDSITSTSWHSAPPNMKSSCVAHGELQEWSLMASHRVQGFSESSLFHHSQVLLILAGPNEVESNGRG